MSAFFGYIANITYYLLFAAVVNMVAPAGKYKKFVSLVMGLTLVVIIIAPLRNMGTDFNAMQFFSGATALPAFAQEQYSHFHNSHLSAAFEEQLFFQLEAMLSRHGFTLHEAEFTYTQDFSQLTAVWASVSTAESRRVPFIRIEPVQVNRSPSPTEENDPQVNKAKNLIADFYHIPAMHIHITILTR
jgi:stage III sporulation protein AF